MYKVCPADLSCNFSKNITWTLIAFCKGNLCVGDLFKLKSIFSVTRNTEEHIFSDIEHLRFSRYFDKKGVTMNIAIHHMSLSTGFLK